MYNSTKTLFEQRFRNRRNLFEWLSRAVVHIFLYIRNIITGREWVERPMTLSSGFQFFSSNLSEFRFGHASWPENASSLEIKVTRFLKYVECFNQSLIHERSLSLSLFSLGCIYPRTLCIFKLMLFLSILVAFSSLLYNFLILYTCFFSLSL